MEVKSLDEIFCDYNVTKRTKVKKMAVTVWVPVESKERYDKLQELSERDYSKKLSELFVVAVNNDFQKVS
jgi:hypothetical protein